MRICVAGVLLLQALAIAGSIQDLYGEHAIVQWTTIPGMSSGNGLIPDSPRIQWVASRLMPYGVSVEDCVRGVFLAYVVSLSFLLIGWRSNIAGGVAWLTHLAMNHSGFATIYGVDQFANIALFYCMWMPIGHAFSVDSQSKRLSSEATTTSRICLRILQGHLSIVYLATGLEKAAGEQWWNGEAIWRATNLPELAQFDFTWLASVPWLATALCLGTLFVEVFYPLFIWPTKTRKLMGIATLGLHVGIAATLGLVSFSALMASLTFSAFLISSEPVVETVEAPSPVRNTESLPATALLDTDDDEKERGHSIMSAVCHFEHNGKRINLIDTPGYPDFIGGAIGALSAVETAVVTVSAGAGIEVNTRRTFQRAGEAGVGRMVLLNKCDMDNVNFAELVEMLQETFGQGCVPLNVPVGIGADFSGVVSTLNIPDSVPDGVIADPAEINQTVMDAIAEADEDLMERYLEGEELSKEEVASGLKTAVAAGTLIPIFCASSKTGVGMEEFMDALAEVALSPLEMQRTAIGPDGGEYPLKPTADAPLVTQVFKTRIDPFVARMSYLRVYSGTLSKDSSVDSTGASRGLKISQVLEVQGGKQDPVDSATAGDIVAIVKMEELSTGDTITKGVEGVKMPPIPFPTPMIGLAVEPKTQADQQKISGALQKIVDEDATFQVRRDPQTKEMVMQGMSELHLLIVQDRLIKRDKVEVDTHQPKVPYRETVNGAAEGSYRHKKQSGGSGQFGEVHFRISACPQDIDPEEYFTKSRFESMREFHYDPELNSCFVDRISGGSIPNNFIPAIEKGVRERMTKGVIAGYQVQDVVCELYFGKDHPVDSNETAFKTAASMCFRNVFKEANPALLEPIVSIEITVPGDKLGDITSDLNTRRGRMEGMDGAPGGYQILHAKVPLAEVMTYARSLSSMTGGQGSFTMELSHYEVVPPNEQSKIVAAAKKAAEEEG
eukprot:g8437.t1